MAPEPARVFISYSSVDGDCAREVKAMLERHGINCWFAPVDILAGRWPKEIGEAIRGCGVLLLILSEASNGSKHVYREVALAAQHGKPLVTLQIAALSPADDLAYFLSGLQIQRAYPGPPRDYYDKLALDVRAALGLPVPVPPPAPVTYPPISRFVVYSLVVAVAAVLGLTLWAYSFTDLGWKAYSIPWAVITSVHGYYVKIYAKVPDAWKPLIVRKVRGNSTNPGMGARTALLGVDLLLLSLLGCTGFVGTVQVIATNEKPRKLAIQSEFPDDWRFSSKNSTMIGGGRPNPKILRPATWITHRPMIVRTEFLPDKSVDVVPWDPQTLDAPDGFLDRPTVLIRPNDDTLAHPHDGYLLVVTVRKPHGNTTQYPGLKTNLLPFWIGCSGGPVKEDPDGTLPFPCSAPESLGLDETVTLDIVSGDGYPQSHYCVPLKPGQQRSADVSVLRQPNRTCLP